MHLFFSRHESNNRLITRTLNHFSADWGGSSAIWLRCIGPGTHWKVEVHRPLRTGLEGSCSKHYPIVSAAVIKPPSCFIHQSSVDETDDKDDTNSPSLCVPKSMKRWSSMASSLPAIVLFLVQHIWIKWCFMSSSHHEPGGTPACAWCFLAVPISLPPSS